MRLITKTSVLGCAALLTMGVARAQAQFPTVTIIAEGKNGYEATVGGKRMLIISQELVDSIAVWHPELKLLRKENELLRRTVTAHENASTALEKARGDAGVYVSELERQLAGYRELAEGYKRLNAPRTLSLEGGFGASGADTRPALVFGLGFNRLRVWTLLQENNVGGFVGANFPLF